MKAGSREPKQPERPEQPSRNNLWPAAATKDLGESAQTAQLGEKTLGEINTRRDKRDNYLLIIYR